MTLAVVMRCPPPPPTVLSNQKRLGGVWPNHLNLNARHNQSLHFPLGLGGEFNCNTNTRRRRVQFLPFFLLLFITNIHNIRCAKDSSTSPTVAATPGPNASPHSTSSFLIPYMAIRLNDDAPATPTNTPLSSLMLRGSSLVGLTGAFVCLASLLWGLFGRPDHPEFGGIHQRCHFLVTYIGSERLAYAFVWDMCFYAVFQPWLIGDNLPQPSPALLRYLRFVPVLGLLAYLVSLHDSQD